MHPRILTALLAAGLGMSGVHAQVTLSFDTDAEGFIDGSDGSNGTTAWSAAFGGSLALTNIPSNWQQATAKLDVNANPTLSAEFELALTNGGTLSYTMYVLPIVEVGAGSGTPGWFQGIQIWNSQAGWDQTVGGASTKLVALGGGDFPLTEPYQFEVSMEIQAVAAGGATAGDDWVDSMPGSTYNELFLGLNSEAGSFEHTTLHIDNLTIEANETAGPVVTPKLTIEPATPGLHLMTLGNSRWDRRMIRTPADFSQNSWVGEASAGTPVSYSFEISEYPQQANFPTYLYFIPGVIEAEDHPTDPDYTVKPAFRLQVQRSTTGEPQASAALQYKTSTATASNGNVGYEYWVAEPDPAEGLGGQLAYLASDEILGTWTLTFTSDTDFTITAPDGATTSGSMLQSVADLFAEPLMVYLAARPDAAGNEGLGLTAVYSRFTISGTPEEFDEDFVLAIDESNGYYEPTPLDRAGVVVATATNPYWLRWTLPASGYTLQHADDMEFWGEIDTTNTITDPNKDVRYLVDDADLLDPAVGFFHLLKPAITP